MRQSWLVILCLGGLCLLRAEPTLVVKETPLERKGTKLVAVDNAISFENGVLQYHYVLDPANGKLIRQQWGDFFFGLRFGTYSNGGWDIWKFLGVPREKRDLVADGVADVSLMPFGSGVLAKLRWQNGLILRMIQLSAMRNWLFLQVETDRPMDAIQFSILPGGAHWGIKGREGHVTDSVNDWNSVTQKTMVAPQKAGLAIYNRNYHERYGNFLVLKPECFVKITTHGARNVALEFQPKDGRRIHEFALGYFYDQPLAETLGRFFSEQLPNIEEELRTMDWKPEPDLKTYQENFDFVEKMLGTQADEKQRQDFQSIKDMFQNAVKSQKTSELWQTMQKLEKYRIELGKNMLERFR